MKELPRETDVEQIQALIERMKNAFTELEVG
jgi:hypothetical protein